MEKLTLSTQLINGILQYLSHQPYAQVAQLIEGIQKEAQEQAQQPVEKVTDAP
jgi:hypothetical protein